MRIWLCKSGVLCGCCDLVHRQHRASVVMLWLSVGFRNLTFHNQWHIWCSVHLFNLLCKAGKLITQPEIRDLCCVCVCVHGCAGVQCMCCHSNLTDASGCVPFMCTFMNKIQLFLADNLSVQMLNNLLWLCESYSNLLFLFQLEQLCEAGLSCLTYGVLAADNKQTTLHTSLLTYWKFW